MSTVATMSEDGIADAGRNSDQPARYIHTARACIILSHVRQISSKHSARRRTETQEAGRRRGVVLILWADRGSILTKLLGG
jgi:hypothetical protein